MHAPFFASLAALGDLSAAQQRGVIFVLTRVGPEALVRVAERDDLSSEVRADLVRATPAFLVEAVLERGPVSLDLVRAATLAHGSLPGVLLLCAQRGWHDEVLEIAGGLSPGTAVRVADRWKEAVGGPMPGEVRAELVQATLTEREPRPNLSTMSKFERDQALGRLNAARRERRDAAWQLLQSDSGMWLELATGGRQVADVRVVLLRRAEDLPDEILLACLPEIVKDSLRDLNDELFAGIRLTETAQQLRRWPRVRQIAPEAIRAVLDDVAAVGWRPEGGLLGPDWSAIAAFAELADRAKDRGILSDAVAVIRRVQPPSTRSANTDPDTTTEWYHQRAEAVAALVINPHTPHADLVDLIPMLDERALLRIADRGADAELTILCRQRLGELRKSTTVARDSDVPIIEVPTDEDLAGHPDPVIELTRHLKHIRARAAQRDATCTGLLRSRFTTAEILRALPATAVLASTEQADLTARIIADTCSDDTERWTRLASGKKPSSKRTTFGEWLDGLVH